MITVTVTRRWFCFTWTTTKQVPARRTFVYAMDRTGGATLEVDAYNVGQALTLLRETHGYRALDNAQLIDIR